MRDLKGFIFDLDGVLVNTVDLHYRAWMQVFAEFGIAFSRSEMDRFRGIHQREILTAVLNDLPEAEISGCLARKANYYRQLLDEAQSAIVYPYSLELLYAAKAQGMKIGLASSSINAHYVLEIAGLRPLFDAVADGNQVCRSKPAPDIFVWVAGALGLRPDEIIVVEDSAAGIAGAKRAGMFAVGVDVRDGATQPDVNLMMNELNFDRIISQYNDAEKLLSG